MTEEEAKTKLCPNKFGWDIADAGNYEVSGYCEASDCMMWTKTMIQRTRDNGTYIDTEDGRCGLAK